MKSEDMEERGQVRSGCTQDAAHFRIQPDPEGYPVHLGPCTAMHSGTWQGSLIALFHHLLDGFRIACPSPLLIHAKR
jgi:hypothetical protein